MPISLFLVSPPNPKLRKANHHPQRPTSAFKKVGRRALKMVNRTSLWKVNKTWSRSRKSRRKQALLLQSHLPVRNLRSSNVTLGDEASTGMPAKNATPTRPADGSKSQQAPSTGKNTQQMVACLHICG